MTCGGIMELGRGFLEVILQIKMEIMALKKFRHHPIFLEADLALLIGLIMKETFGYLVEVTRVFIQGVYLSIFSGRLNDLWKFDDEGWVWVSGTNLMDQNGIYGDKGVPDSNNIPGGREGAVSWMDNSGNMWLFGGKGYASNDSFGNPIRVNIISNI
jgi:hypothetical protein